MKVVLVLIMMIAGSMAFAHGNSYNTYGNTSYGTNLNTGRNWQTTYAGGGSMHGTDSRGNSWNYDKSTSVYQNYGTGKTCFGTGENRVCN